MRDSIHEAIRALQYSYGRLIDDDRLEGWPGLFTERGVYKVIPRENLGSEPALPVFYCDGRGMMVDRVRSLRKANVYNLHWGRHVITNVELLAARNDVYEVVACFTVYQTDLEGQTRLFAVGQYHDVVERNGGELHFREKTAVLDTFSIPNLLAVPL